MAPYPQEAVEPNFRPEEWVDAYGDYLYRYAHAQLRESPAAEEAVQETFLSAIRNLDQYDGSGPQLAWLLGILKRKIIDAIRSRERRIDNASLSAFDSEELFFNNAGSWLRESVFGSIAGTDLDESDFWEVVRNCLASIAQKQANVFILRVMEQLSTEVVSKELGIAPTAVWARLHRARLNLAKCVMLKLNLNAGDRS